MTTVETTEYAEVSAEKVQRGIDFVQDKLERAEELATAENVQRGFDFVQDKIGRAEEEISSEKVQRGIDFVKDKVERTEDIAVSVEDFAIVTAKGTTKKKRCSRRGLILGGVIVVGVIVAVMVIRSRSKETAANEVEDPAAEDAEDASAGETNEDPS
jgi:hypothetical protein